MPRFTRSSVEAVRDAVDMVDLVSARTELRKAGARSYVGHLPLPRGAQPVVQRRARREALPLLRLPGGRGRVQASCRRSRASAFNEAVELLAQRYGVQLEVEAEDPRDAERRLARERLLELLERTAAFYVRYLWDSHEARARTRLPARARARRRRRCASSASATRPSAWDKVLTAPRARRRSPTARSTTPASRHGRNGGQIYDRFRARITFPLCDSRGRVLGFGARAMGEARGAKYVNTPENDIFHKSRVLFGVRPRAGERRARRARRSRWRATPTSSRCTRPGCATASGSWGRR